ncbi:PspC domain-containing protein [Streptosporangium sp. NPDC049046]|uniref:PspC domain-containing protein n=1 Tax=Streptosporangium sp. NPDC049046 TaxID=3155031 RepID=UPI00341747CF
MNDTGRAHGPASSPSASSFSGKRSEERFEEHGLKRSNEGRMLTGVCAGLGRYAQIDPVVLRVGFAVLVLGSGIGIMLYLAAFLLMRETDGGPGYFEQWTRRDFDSETVLTLLTGLFALGLIVNVSSDGIGTGTVVVGTVFAIALLAAHSRGVDLLAVARSLPDRLRRRRTPHPPGRWPGPSTPAGPPGVGERDPAAHAAAPWATGPTAYAEAPTAGPPGTTSGDTAHAGTTAEDAAHAAPRPGGETVTEPYAPEAGPGSTTSHPLSTPQSPTEHAPGMPPGPAMPPREARGETPQDPYYAHTRPSFDSSGAPFSPYGPYQPLDPRRRQPYSPYDPAAYGGPVVAPPGPRRPRSLVGSITICLAMIVGGVIVAIQSASGSVNMTVVGGAVLVVIGAGLLVATWFGRGAGLVATGTILSIALVAGPTLGGMPKKFGDFDWRPVTLSEVARDYSVGVGAGRLDLSDLVLPQGSRTIVDVSISVGSISVILPATARVEVNSATRFGDIKIDHAVEGGADIAHNKILEPEVPPKGDVATIVLNVKAGIGDVEVRRAA